MSYEAARRRKADGVGTDRSWWVGADGEVMAAEVLAELTAPSRWERLRGRAPAWRVLHAIPRWWCVVAWPREVASTRAARPCGPRNVTSDRSMTSATLSVSATRFEIVVDRVAELEPATSAAAATRG